MGCNLYLNDIFKIIEKPENGLFIQLFVRRQKTWELDINVENNCLDILSYL